MVARVNAIVIGAGLSGLKAAGDLVAKGKSVIVVEARERVGGRVLRGELCGRVIDQGAQWLSPRHGRLLAEARRFGHETTLQYSEGKSILSLDGRRRESQADMPRLPVLASIELRMLQRRWNQEMATLPADAPWTAPNAKAWDAQTLETWILKNLSTRGSRGFARLISRGAFGANASEVSYLWMVEMLRAAGGFAQLAHVKGGIWDATFKGGVFALARHMADALGERIMCDAPAPAIVQDTDGVVVTTDKGTFEADYGIVAMPPALCTQIDFGAALSAQRAQLARRMPQSAMIKVHVAYREPFWRHNGHSGRVVSDALPLGIVMEDTPDEGAALLIGLAEGAQALELSAMDAEARRARIMDCLTGLFGPQANDAIGYSEKDWLADEWSRGAMGHMGPGVLTHYGPALRAPCGRVHWASSETATQGTGFMEGALQSGARAAEEVVARLNA
jgi:monoamine oxidase